MVWFLEEGTESDFYFFLELYIRRWQLVADRIKQNCDVRRNMKEDSTNLRGSLDDVRDLETIPVGNMNITDPEPMQILDRAYFEKPFAFHPYDWYVGVSRTLIRFQYRLFSPNFKCCQISEGTSGLVQITIFDTKGRRQSPRAFILLTGA